MGKKSTTNFRARVSIPSSVDVVGAPKRENGSEGGRVFPLPPSPVPICMRQNKQKWPKMALCRPTRDFGSATRLLKGIKIMLLARIWAEEELQK